MNVTPQTNLFLLKVPIEIDNKNQLTFTNKTNQFNYFSSLPFLEIENISYQRKNNVIRYPGHIDTILEYNYCMYQNSNYTNKWFYSFITNMRYVNDNMTEITISTDVWQTWQFDLEFLESFIEREMINVSDDIPGSNLLPEGLETGEYITSGDEISIEDLSPAYIVAYIGDSYVDREGNSHTINQLGYLYNGIYSAITFIVCDTIGFTNFMILMSYGDNSSKVITCFTVPSLAVKEALAESGQHDYKWVILDEDYEQKPKIQSFSGVPNTIDGYTPKNQKLKTYPYCYLGFNPQNGSTKILRYEDFTNQPSFKIISEINPNPQVCLIPLNYKKIYENLQELLTLSGYPTISYKTDYYNTWLAQNSQIVTLNTMQQQYNYEVGQVQTAVGGYTDLLNKAIKGDVIGSISNSANLGIELSKNDINHDYYIKNQLAQIEKQSMLADNGSLSSSNATLIGYNMLKNIFLRYNIKKQFAERIDKFFDYYGYLTNQFKIPNLNNRPNWNYVKTIGINIHAYIPQEDLQIIKNMFNSGITLWHNPSTFLDYSQNNR